ncbi:uncharacterized protein CBL_09095 [Carabus blaptoides fortunei]
MLDDTGILVYCGSQLVETIKMAVVKHLLFVYTLYVIEYAHCCWLEEDEVYCNTFLELSTEGQPEWTNVSVTLVICHQYLHKMAQIKSLLLFYTVYLIQCTHCCWEAEDKVIYCNTFLELSMEGKREWTNVSVVNFNDDPLHTLQAASFEKVPNIQVLSIVSTINGIESGAFNSLKKLTEIQLFNNEITDLPPKLFNIKSLKRIWFIENQISGIPADSFKKIEGVAFINNSMPVVKADLVSNSATQELFLTGCDIEEIEDGAFKRMNSLYLLALTRNMLTTFNVKRVMGNSLSLEVLYVDANRLTSVPRDMFDGAEMISIISLESNHIESIEDGAFSRLDHLVVLDLSDNRLAQVHPQVFKAPRQPSLKALLLHDNRLTFINLGLLARAYRLAYFAYGGNPIQCPCSDGIKDYLKLQNIQQTCFDKLYSSGNFPTCVFPTDYPNTCLYDVDLRNDLYDFYKVVRLEYGKLQRDCNISNSVIKDLYGKDSKFYHLFEH